MFKLCADESDESSASSFIVSDNCFSVCGDLVRFDCQRKNSIIIEISTLKLHIHRADARNKAFTVSEVSLELLVHDVRSSRLANGVVRTVMSSVSVGSPLGDDVSSMRSFVSSV